MAIPDALMRKIMETETAGWTAEQRAALLTRLDREATRLLVARDYPTAGALARRVDPTTRQTEALELIDEQLEWALATPNARLVISMPPQQGKTQRVGVWGVLRALVQNPDRRIVLASYSETLARATAREARNHIYSSGSTATDPLSGARLPDRLGLTLAGDKSAAGNWKLAGHRGGVYATGVGGSLTGQPADLMVIDDPLKGMTEADSRAEREKVITWWESVAQTRLAPGAPVIIIATRWHEDDLTGHLLQQDAARPAEQRQWRTVNIPAISTRGVPDALHRAPGEAMPSARGTTLDDWHRIRDSVGDRVWSALYLGAPTPAQGGLFSQEWFDRHRAPALPDTVAARLVAVDPAETGEHDEAGIIGLAVTADGRAWVTDDHSGRYTSEQWARQATLLALRTGATELSFEAYTTGTTYEAVLQAAWKRIRHEARLLTAAAGDVGTAALNYSTQDGAPANPVAALAELQGIRIPDQDTPPFHIRPWRMKGNKTARAAGARQAASTGRLRMVGTHPDLEGQAVAWQAGQSSPDRMDALVQAYERAMAVVGGQASIATPTDVVGQQANRMGADFWSQTIG